jgi:hypothetical protein
VRGETKGGNINVVGSFVAVDAFSGRCLVGLGFVEVALGDNRRIIVCYCLLESCVLIGPFLVARQGDICASFEELFPKLCALPYVSGSFGILLDNGENTSCDNAVGPAEVVVDFWKSREVISNIKGPKLWRCLFTLESECDGLFQLF